MKIIFETKYSNVILDSSKILYAIKDSNIVNGKSINLAIEHEGGITTLNLWAKDIETGNEMITRLYNEISNASIRTDSL